jgi:predicted nuclease of predicted toxin-antitoxin system
VSLRFLLDEDISGRVAEGLKARGVDAVSVHELNRTGLADEDQLAFAVEEGRVLVTYNRADFQALDAEWRMRGLSHPGILWAGERTIPRRAFGQLIRALERAAEEHDSLDGLCLPLTPAPEAP